MLRKAFISIFGILSYLKKINELKLKFIFHKRSIKSISKTKKVIIASNTISAIKTTNIELYISQLLYKYGYEVLFFGCNGSIAGCSLCEKERGGKLNLSLKEIKEINCLPCKSLTRTIINLNKNFSLNFWENISLDDQNEISEFIKDFNTNKQKHLFNKCEIHEHAKSTLSRFLGKSINYSEIFINKYLENLYIDFLESACFTAKTWIKIIDKNNPDLIILNHGLYIPQGVILEVARLKGVEVTTFHPGYRKGTILIAHGDTYHKTLVEKNVSSILDKELNSNQIKIIKSYLKSRRDGSQDQITFVHKNAEREKIPNSLKFLNNQILVLTNVDWDAQSHYKNNVYETMNEWILDIINLAKKKSNYNFIFRCHPAEVTGRRVSAVKSSDFIRNNSVGIKNLFIVKSEDRLSTYKLIEQSKAVIVYATKTSIEAACMKKPVLICGESCLKGKDIGIDLCNKGNLEDQFYKLVKYHKVNHERALRYAYHFFYREMIDLPKYYKTKKTIQESKFIKRIFNER